MNQARRWIERSAWSPDAAVRLAAAILVGGGVCFLVWLAASNEPAANDQVTLIPVSVLGLVIALYAQAMWLLNGRRAIGERARHLLSDPSTIRASATEQRADGALVSGPGLGRFHRRSCPIAEPTWTSTSREQHATAGRQACGVCRP